MLLCHACCVLFRLRCKEHNLMLSSYQLITGKIENPYCSACKHSSQDTSHLILHCPAKDSLHRSLFGVSLRPLVQAFGELPGFWGSMNFRHAPIPRKGSSNNNSKIEITDALLRKKGVSKFRRSSCKQNYVTVCNLLSQDSITNYLYIRNTITHKNSIY